MALQFAFHLGSLAFATSLLRNAFAGAELIGGLQGAFVIGFVFFGIGFAIGECCRHMMEELVARELAAARDAQENAIPADSPNSSLNHHDATTS